MEGSGGWAAGAAKGLVKAAQVEWGAEGERDGYFFSHLLHPVMPKHSSQSIPFPPCPESPPLGLHRQDSPPKASPVLLLLPIVTDWSGGTWPAIPKRL